MCPYVTVEGRFGIGMYIVYVLIHYIMFTMVCFLCISLFIFRAAFMCGREPNFELPEEEKRELRKFKWDEFLAETRHAITRKSNLSLWTISCIFLDFVLLKF